MISSRRLESSCDARLVIAEHPFAWTMEHSEYCPIALTIASTASPLPSSSPLLLLPSRTRNPTLDRAAPRLERAEIACSCKSCPPLLFRNRFIASTIVVAAPASTNAFWAWVDPLLILQIAPQPKYWTSLSLWWARIDCTMIISIPEIWSSSLVMSSVISDSLSSTFLVSSGESE